MSWLCLSPRRPGFTSGSVHIRFVMDEVIFLIEVIQSQFIPVTKLAFHKNLKSMAVISSVSLSLSSDT